MNEDNKVRVVVHSKGTEAIEEIGRILKEHFSVVVFTGMTQNTKPPHIGDWRGYFAVVLEEKEDEE